MYNSAMTSPVLAEGLEASERQVSFPTTADITNLSAERRNLNDLLPRPNGTVDLSPALQRWVGWKHMRVP